MLGQRREEYVRRWRGSGRGEGGKGEREARGEQEAGRGGVEAVGVGGGQGFGGSARSRPSRRSAVPHRGAGSPSRDEGCRGGRPRGVRIERSRIEKGGGGGEKG